MSTKSFLQKKAYTRMLIAIFVGMMLTASWSIVSVKASPITITVSPTSGPVGTTVTVSGNNATASGEVRVYVAIFIFGFFVETTTANSTGGYSVNITVPAMPADTYTILVLDVETGDTNVATFTIQPKITLTPEEGSYNDEVTVKGYGFDSVSLITLTFDGEDVTPIPQPETNDFGSFEVKFNVPSMPNGTYTVTADDGTNNATASFTMIPKITLNPTSGPQATLVLINGGGFGSSVDFSIAFNAINVTMYPGVLPTETDGSFMQVFFVPYVPDGTYTVKATDETGNSATAPFVVPSPVMTLTPNITSGSSVITATGSGFPPNAPILLYLEDIFMVNFVELMIGSQALYVDEYGSYEYSFIVPVEKPGVYRVVAHSLTDGVDLTIGEELALASLTIVENALLVDIKDEIATIIIPDLGTIKADLTAINARITSINGTVATIETNIGEIKADLTTINASLVSIDGSIAIIETDIGTIETDLTAINAKLVSINGTVATIETDLGIIEADLTDINARIISIDGNVATIETDIGTIAVDVSDIQREVVPTGYEFGLLATILALAAAIGAWLSAILIKRKPIQLFKTERPKTKPK